MNIENICKYNKSHNKKDINKNYLLLKESFLCSEKAPVSNQKQEDSDGLAFFMHNSAIFNKYLKILVIFSLLSIF